MLLATQAALPAGGRVRVKAPTSVPEWSVWDPCQRTSTSTKRRLQELFFRGDKRIQGEVVYITSESLRKRLRNQGRTKVELRDSAGASIVIVADAKNLRMA
jgi:hypothetical protein